MHAPPSGLARFVEAQRQVYPRVLAELSAGQKNSDWMWFVFPQVAGLGRSAMAKLYAINSMDEARAYLANETLGARLRECIKLLLTTRGRTAFQIFQSPDDIKFRASMTLFAHADPDEPLFQAALDKFFMGKPDGRTLEILVESRA